MMKANVENLRRGRVIRAFTGAVATASAVIALATGPSMAQTDDGEPAVAVTVTLDDPVLVVGQSTVLRVFGRIDPALEPESERIFSWYLDVLASGGTALAPDWATLASAASDKVPQTSGAGFSDGRRRRGIHDTFLELPGAGHGSPVELLAVTVTATALGETSFAALPGTGVANLSEDFIVATTGPGTPPTGGDYTAAAVTGRVVTVDVFLDPRWVATGDGRTEIRFNPIPGRTHRVEVSTTLDPESWTPLPGAPHDLGSVIDPDSATAPSEGRRFYRVIVEDEDP